jgi:hypothetical protein
MGSLKFKPNFGLRLYFLILVTSHRGKERERERERESEDFTKENNKKSFCLIYSVRHKCLVTIAYFYFA